MTGRISAVFLSNGASRSVSALMRHYEKLQETFILRKYKKRIPKLSNRHGQPVGLVL